MIILNQWKYYLHQNKIIKFVLELRFTLIAAIAAIPRMATMLKIFFLILL